jgi:hypothetical protein
MKNQTIKLHGQNKKARTLRARAMARAHKNTPLVSGSLPLRIQHIEVDLKSVGVSVAGCSEVYYDKTNKTVGFGKSYGVTSYNGRPIDGVDVIVIEK